MLFKPFGRRRSALLVAILVAIPSVAIDEIHAQSAPTVIAGSGDVTPIIDLYRKLLGEPNNGNANGTQSGGRREINWDGVPDERAAPNMLPGDIFLQSRRHPSNAGKRRASQRQGQKPH